MGNTHRASSIFDEPLDFFTANLLGLVFSALILVSFLLMPWLWDQAKYNGAYLMAEVLFDGTFQNYGSDALVMLPLVALAAGGLSIWGIVNPQRSGLASALTVVAGVVGLYYFYDFYFNQDGAFAEVAQNNVGNGFKLALVAISGLVVQIAVVLRPVAARQLANWGEHNTAMAALNRWFNKLGSGGQGLLDRIPHKATPYLFLAFPLLLYTVWILGPTFYTFYLSLTRWDGVSSPYYIGLDNYSELFGDRIFKESLGNNVRWLVIFITVPTTLGLAMALIFNTEMRGGKWYKVSFYSPLVLSGPVIGLVWLWLYHPDKGLLNSFLRDTGITSNPPSWHADREIAIYCVIAAAVWRQVGYVMVLYLAGLKNIDPAMVDAGLVDGANRWQLFRHVIFPLLAPVTTIIFVISVIDSLRAFDLVQIMTRGGQSTQVLANFMYNEAFNNYRMGYGAAIAVVLFSISMFFIGIYLWLNLRDELEY